MGYYMLVYSQDEPRSVESFEEFFEDEDDVTVESVKGKRGSHWRQLHLRRDGDSFALVELITGGDVADRLNGEIANVLETKPRCNAEWVAKYLRKVACIYQFQILGGDVDDSLHDLFETLCYGGGGILYAEGEGYSDDQGCHVTWEFSDDVSGEWTMALYGEGDSWTWFRMQLGDPEQRAAFLDGRRPDGT